MIIIKSLAQHFHHFFLAPARCELCDQYVKIIPSFCSDCQAQVKMLSQSHCQICAMPFESLEASPHTCSVCIQKAPAFSKVYAAFEWCDMIAKSIHKVKFGAQISLLEVLACHGHKDFLASLAEFRPDKIVPVPLHWRRSFKRGYNQASLLAEKLRQFSNLDIPIVESLSRDYQKAQAQKNREERLRDLRGVFKIEKPELFLNQRVLIVDDIMTTGATAHSLASEILSVGAKEVRVFVLARVGLKK
ncbi:MAG: ComF family protein [Deltaproteobacteria bacterium]|nr:ComF family protein [Deltaproteobacteria bacterium]